MNATTAVQVRTCRWLLTGGICGYLSTVFSLGLLTATACAEPVPEVMTREVAVRWGLQNNPELAALRQQHGISAGSNSVNPREQNRQAHPFRRAHSSVCPKKPGRRKGHKADLRPVPTPEQIDRVIDVPLGACPLCEAPLYDQGQVVQYQTDLPPIVPSSLSLELRLVTVRVAANTGKAGIPTRLPMPSASPATRWDPSS
jgi:hypothetical protein